MLKLWLDRETFSELDIKIVGTYVYAHSAEDLLIAYALNDDPVQVWDVTEDPLCPADLHHALQHADEVYAHKAEFDKAVHNAPAQLHLPRIELTRWRCTMALALSHALPGALDGLCSALEVRTDLAKLKDGKALINLFCKPQPANRKVRRATRLSHPEEWARFKLYAANDVAAMRECARLIPRWNWNDSAIAEWHCDQRINERGFAVDMDLVTAGAAAAIVEKERIGKHFNFLTGGVVARPSQRDQFKAFVLQRFGITLADTKGDTFNQYLKDSTLDAVLAQLMRLSIAANKTSTAKYAALHPAVSADGRFRGGLQFAGASRTRRWAGRLFQPQNLPSRGLPKLEHVLAYIENLKAGVHDLFHDDLMRLGAAALRGCVVVPPGRKMCVADLSNIEGRFLAWVAGEEWKLEAFRAYDAGKGPDLYNITATSIIGGDPYKVPKIDRNVFGKVPDLASGYQGGVAGYQTFAKAYGVRMADHWDTIQRMISPAHVAQARENLEGWGRQQLADLEISEIEWLASETCKLAWRARHPATVALWANLQKACKNAINEWNRIFSVGQFLHVKCETYMGKRWMRIRLPSGRYLTYFDPKIIGKDLTYMGDTAEQGKTTRQWVRTFTHGGKLTGNVCQAGSRDILMPSLVVAEARGYLPILSVHDEALTETPDTDDYTADGLSEIMSDNPAWATGLPLAAAGFEAYRYKKED